MTETQPRGRKKVLDILKIVNRICEENKIQYTLLFDTLLSQSEEEGKSDWLKNISIGLLYPDYIKLMELIQDDRDGVLYLFNRKSSKDFNALYTHICMESRVKLPEERKKDKPYYDYFIVAYPVIYGGNTLSEYNSLKRKIKYYNSCLEAVAPVPFQKGIKKNLRSLKKRIWCRRKREKEQEMSEFFKFLSVYGAIPSKYVLIPSVISLNGIMCLAETYRNTIRCRFDGIDVYCLKEKGRWLKDCYSKSEKERVMGNIANRAILEGPETIRRVQLVALENLCEFDRICRKYEIPYILAAGTLLGAVRHKGFIPWDDDIDIFILNDEWIKFEKAAKKEMDQSKFFLRTQETDIDNNLVLYQIKRNRTTYIKGGREQFNTHRGIAIDIIPFFNSPRSRILFFLQDKICRFFKTMTWAHMGSGSEKKKILRAYYKLLTKVSNKKSYGAFYRMANLVKEPGPYLTYLCVIRNPYKKGFNQRKYFEDICEVEFEGHKFPAPREYDDFLQHCYGKDYMKLPLPRQRVNHHLPDKIQLDGLYEY